MKLAIVASMFIITASAINAETLDSLVGDCVDAEYYDDIMYYNEDIEILGYVENGSHGAFDKLGNVAISDIVRENGQLLEARFNTHENTVCIRELEPNVKYYVHDYAIFNPWGHMD